MRLPEGLTVDAIVDAVEQQGLDDPGFCLACGARAEGVEPDAQDYRCESCGEHRVYGAEELLLMVAF